MDSSQFPKACKNFLSLQQEVNFTYVGIGIVMCTEIHTVEKTSRPTPSRHSRGLGTQNDFELKHEHTFLCPEDWVCTDWTEVCLAQQEALSSLHLEDKQRELQTLSLWLHK